MLSPNETSRFIQNRLFALQDLSYKAFHSKLIPTIDPDTIIGVRTPDIRSLAKELKETQAAYDFLNILPHNYYEENNLHAALIEYISDYDTLIAYIDAFLPYVDNWATCDMFAPKSLKKHLPQLYDKILEWISSDNAYTIRFGIGMLQRFFLDSEFKSEMLGLVSGIHSDEYYVNMMIAWYFSTALVKQYDAAVAYLENNELNVWIHNKAIQKAVESYRITPEIKTYLKTLKRKVI